MIRFRFVQALFARAKEQDDRALVRFSQLEVARQKPERAPVPLFFARKARLA